MLMMLALRLTSLNPSNHWVELLHCCRRFNAEEIGRKTKKHIRLMLMMLALRCTNSISITGSNCCGCRGFNGREIGQESLNRKPADADDARAAAH